MARDADYILELASTVNLLFAAGINDPQASEIAHKHFADRTLGGEIIEGVRKRLPRIRRVLEEDYGHQVCPLGRTYYTRFRRRPPLTRADARRCLPVGHGMRQEGLYRLSGGSDELIWREWQSLNANSGWSKGKRTTDRLLQAVADGQLPESAAAELLADGLRHAQPDNPELAARVMRALPSPDDDEGESQAV